MTFNKIRYFILFLSESFVRKPYETIKNNVYLCNSREKIINPTAWKLILGLEACCLLGIGLVREVLCMSNRSGKGLQLQLSYIQTRNSIMSLMS